MIPLALMLAAGLALADGPTTQPGNASDSAPAADNAPPASDNAPPASENAPAPDRARRGGRMGRWFNGFRGRNANNGERPLAELQRTDAPSDEEWEQVGKFSQDNFPNRWKMFERVRDNRGDDSPVVAQLKLRMANRYRALMKAQTDAPGVYETALEQGKLEDQAWGIAQQLQADPGNADLTQQLHDAVMQLEKTSLEERRRRLDMAKQALDAEEDTYNEDSKNIDQIVEARMNRLTGAGANFERLVPATNKATTAPSD